MPKILAVDDDPQVRELLRAFLESRGYEVVLAVDGRAGLAAIEAQPPDLVLLDLMMPGVNGLEVLRSTHAAHPELPIIVVTAIHEEEIGKDALRAGAVDYVTKPIELAHLERAVAAVLVRA